MAAPNLRSMVFFTAAITVVVVFMAGAAAEPTKARLNMRNCDPNGDGHYNTPSVANCPSFLVIPKGAQVHISCRQKGEVVHGDPWWLYVSYGKYKGFVSDYYVDCGGKYCNPGKYCW